jgi:hypothetical protein
MAAWSLNRLPGVQYSAAKRVTRASRRAVGPLVYRRSEFNRTRQIGEELINRGADALHTCLDLERWARDTGMESRARGRHKRAIRG